MNDALSEFMELCAYKSEEMEVERPRLEKVFKKIDINDEDLIRGKERLLKYYQCDTLKSMRMIIGEFIRQTADMVLADEEGKYKIWVELPMYQIMSFAGAAQLLRPDVVVGCPSMYFVLLMGGIFHKMETMQEYAEARWLPGADSHCGCTKARIGVRALGYIPKADFTISAGFLCDEAPKVDELMHHLFDEKVFAINRPLDEMLYDDPMDNKRGLQLLTENIEALRLELSDALDVDLSDELIKDNLSYWMKIMTAGSEINKLTAAADPQPMHWNALVTGVLISWFNRGKVSYEKTMQIYDLMKAELQEKIKNGEGVVPKGSPRVLCYRASFANPEAFHEMEKYGMNMVCSEDFGNKTFAPEELSAIFDTLSGSQLYAITLMLLPFTYPRLKAENMINACRIANLDGILFGRYDGCRPIYGLTPMVMEWVKKEIGSEVVISSVEMDMVDYRYRGVEQMKTRLQTFAEMLHMRKLNRSNEK